MGQSEAESKTWRSAWQDHKHWRKHAFAFFSQTGATETSCARWSSIPGGMVFSSIIPVRATTCAARAAHRRQVVATLVWLAHLEQAHGCLAAGERFPRAYCHLATTHDIRGE
jgi:hypothetical protein